jgi:hypothetical protein
MSEYKDAPNDLAPRNKSSADDWLHAYIAQLEYKLAKAEADNERLRAFSLKALTVVEWVVGEGFVLQHPHYDADDLLIEGVDMLDVEDTNAARAALAGHGEK